MTWPSSSVLVRLCHVAILALGPAVSPAEPTDAFALLDSTIRAYSELATYQDHGELVSIVNSSDGPSLERFQFETRADNAGGFLIEIRKIDPMSGDQVTWIEDGSAWHWRTGSEGSKATPSVALSLAGGLGMQALDALHVPLLLARDSDLLPPPEAAALDGSEACGDSICDILAISRRGGRSLSRLWIDRRTHLVQRVEVDHLPPSTGGPGIGRPQHTLRIDHQIDSLDEPIVAARLLFTPPSRSTGAATQESTRKITVNQADGDFIVSEEISVDLRSLAVRALDSSGRPIPDLTAADFEVKLGKEEIPVVSADWISSRGQGLEQLPTLTAAPPAPMEVRSEAEGNLIVLFVQADFNAVRVKGHLRILPLVHEFVRALEPEDWVAVVSFDSHLKFWLDFSRDRQAAGEATERAIRFGAQPPVRPGRRLSLARTFPQDEAMRAATPEDALRVTAKSLLDIPGEKIIVYLGWGLGRYGSSGFRMTRAYDRTLATLDAAKASVFVLDVTDADYHTLELGIRQVASDTGGTYSKTDKFARREVLKLVETISGYYLLTLDRSSLSEEVQKLTLGLKNGGGNVLLRERRLRR